MNSLEKRYYVADFETTASEQYEIEGKTKVYLWYIENIYNDYDFAMGRTVEDFHNWVIRGDNHPIQKIIYFHNLSFDILFYEYYLNEIGFVNVEGMKSGENEYLVVRDGFRNAYALQFTIGNVSIEFRDSLKLLQSSVANLPNLRGIEKLDGYDYQKLRYEKSLNDFHPDELLYVKHDVWKVKDVLKELLDMLGDYLTIASSSYNDWMEMYSDGDKWKYRNEMPPMREDDEVLLRKAYNGGIVILPPETRGKIFNENILKFDVNSLYPSTMRHERMPYGQAERIINPINLEHLQARDFNLFVYQVIVNKMTIKDGYHPFISETKNYTFAKKEDYPRELDDVVFQWSCIDFKNVLKYYDIDYYIDFENSFAFRSKFGIFDKYIDTYNHMKENAKNEFEYMFSKFRLNTLYGKFGTRTERTAMRTGMTDDGMIEFIEYDSESNQFYYLPIAIFITAYARDVLITAIQNERVGFVYADTDSVHILEKDFTNSLKQHTTKLGYWDYEGRAVKSLYINNKQYINEMEDGSIERRIASLNRESHHLVNFDNMKKGSIIENGKRMKRHVKGGYIIVSTNFTFT